MLDTIDATASLATRDITKARAFYTDTLGLKIVYDTDDMITLQSGGTTFTVYVSQYAGTNEATALSWSVGSELDAVVRDLRAKGVTFEHYDLPGLKVDGDVHVGEGMRVVWFKDPDGNILNLVDM